MIGEEAAKDLIHESNRELSERLVGERRAELCREVALKLR